MVELARENAQLRSVASYLEQSYDHLLYQVKQLQRHSFGQRSEAFIDSDNPQESLLAHIIVSKLDDRQPYYHLEKQYESRASFLSYRVKP